MNEQGLTLIVVTHDPQIGGRARRQIHLRDGAVLRDERKERGTLRAEVQG
jgi:putative ABC transport system ATP-binding protein